MADADQTLPSIPPFVDAAWLRGRTDPVSLADVRWSLDDSENFDTYLDGHLPGAVYIDLDSVLAAAPSETEGRHPLPSPATFARGLGVAGIGEDETVVAYDHGPGMAAARLVWMLRAVGQPAAVLEGGLAAWTGEVERGEVVRSPIRRAPRAWRDDRFADADTVQRLAGSPAAVVLDARAPERYRGEAEPLDPRAGHVPGAINLPATDNLDAAGCLRPRAELQAQIQGTGVLAAEEVAVYCGSGVTACHDLLVLEHLAGIRGRLFTGSWSAWSTDPNRPAMLGPDPGEPC